MRGGKLHPFCHVVKVGEGGTGGGVTDEVCGFNIHGISPLAEQGVEGSVCTQGVSFMRGDVMRIAGKGDKKEANTHSCLFLKLGNTMG